jgi:hypothetical protein
METATQVVIVSSHGATRLPLSKPRTLHEVRAMVSRAILNHGGDVSALIVSLPCGTSTAVVNL